MGEKLGSENGFPVKILEIGAGDGKLTFSLKQKLDELVAGKFEIVATDSNKWRKAGDTFKGAFPLEELDHEAALKVHNPNIVLCSWMPPNVDFTSAIQKTDSVEEYILIGDPSCCGENYLSWEKPENAEGEYADFEVEDLEELSQYQIGTSDNAHSITKKARGQSITSSFKRV